MFLKAKVYKSESFNPYFNLATEKYLLDTVDNDTVILYLWQNENTVVIGQNQNPWSECRYALLQSEGGNLARRLSGGGAVYHDLGNLNFTFICASENYNLEKQLEVIKTACALTGISARVSGRNDILAGGKKFSGNAFYNSKGKSYHHGTILVNVDSDKMSRYLSPSKAKLEAKGIKSVRSRVTSLSEFCQDLTVEKMKEYMIEAFEQVYKAPICFISDVDTKQIQALTKEFSSSEFLFSKTFDFTCELVDKFEFGSVCIRLEIQKGKITNAQLFTDAMDHTLANKFQTAIIGCNLLQTEIEKALESKLAPNVAVAFTELLKQQIL